MNFEIKNFDTILKKFKVKAPVETSTREEIYKCKRDSLAGILKEKGEYTFFYGLVIWLFYYSGNIGINLSLLWAKVVIITVTISFCISAPATAYIVLQELITHNNVETIQEIKKDEGSLTPIKEKSFRKSIENQVQIGKDDNLKAIPYNKLRINRIIASGVNKEYAAKLTLKLYKELQALYGAERIFFQDVKGGPKSFNKQLIGRISRLDGFLVLNVRIISVPKLELLYNDTIIIKKEEEINIPLEKLINSLKINKKLW